MNKLKDRNINFYMTKDMQDYLPKNTKESKIIKDNTGCSLTHHMLVCGSTNSGKSNTTLNFMSRTNGCWDKIVMVVQKMEPFNKCLKDKLKSDLEMFVGDEGLRDLPDVSKLPDLDKKNDKYILMIFDDCVGENKFTKKINDYFKYGRAKGCHCLFLTQSYKSAGQMISFIRKQCSYVILCGIKNSSELKDILNDYSMGDITSNQMEKMYRFCKEKEDDNEINCMKITTYECEPDKKLSKNWLEYLDPNDFPDEPKKRTSRKKVIIEDDENEE